MKNIYAHTENAQFPAYISVNPTAEGDVSFSVRARGTESAGYAQTFQLTRQQAHDLVAALSAHLAE